MSSLRGRWGVLAWLAILICAACTKSRPVRVGEAAAAPRFASASEGDGSSRELAPAAVYDVFQIPLSLCNVYLIRAPRPILIDAGAPKDLPALTEALQAIGVKLPDLALIVLTHGHADHAGLTADLQAASHAKVALGRADAEMANAGRNDVLRPTSWFARVLKPFVDQPYKPFVPDILVNEELHLAPFGVQGRVLYLPGHTAGSTVTFISGRRAFVGDEMQGGFWGGLIFPTWPGEHYYQADPAANRANIARLVGLGVEHFYLGHGGPVERASVVKAFGL